MIVFGAVGLLVLSLAAWLILGSLGALGTAAVSIDSQRSRLVALIEPARTALEGAADSAANAGTSLGSSATAARDAAGLTTQLADSMDAMSQAAQVSVLGVQPFASLSGELAGVATRSRTLSTDLAATATALDRNVIDATASAADLRALAERLRLLGAELAASGETGTAGTSAVASTGDAAGAVNLARVVIVGLLAWLAVPAVATVWLGRRWRRG